MNHNINGLKITTTGDKFTRVITKPLANTTKRIEFVKLDDVYVYFPEEGEIIITKEDINKF